MADWDPFADPGDEPEASAPAPAPQKPEKAASSGGSRRKAGADDIFAALRRVEAGPAVGTLSEAELATAADGFGQLLDSVFSIDDSDVEALQDAFASVAAAIAGNGSLLLRLWQRGVPLLEAESGSHNLLGLIIDLSLGLTADPSSNNMSDVFVDLPSEGCKASSEVVFLLGWGGGTLADMRDIAELYRELFPGCTVFMSTSNMKQSFGLRCQCAVGIRAAAQAWSSNPGDEPKLLVHLFSNSGMMAWTEILQSWSALANCPDLEEAGVALPLMPLPPMEKVLRGVILDSACDSNVPIGACIQSLVQSIAGMVNLAASINHDSSEEGRKAAELTGKRAIAALIGEKSVAKAYLHSKPEKTLTKLASADTAAAHRLEPPVPMQFIYSKDDTIILCPSVERYLQEVKERPSRNGLTLPRTWCIEKSRHCFHKVNHREEYWKNVKIFSSSTMA